MAEGFYVDINADNNFYVFYYNVNKLIATGVNSVVRSIIGEKAEASLDRTSNSDYSRMVLFDPDSGQVLENNLHFLMQGISAVVNRELAEEILIRAYYYCPKDTGYLASTGRIQEMDDGSCRIFFDCPYAWYVHEFTWKQHDYPTRAHFLTIAIDEVMREHGLL